VGLDERRRGDRADDVDEHRRGAFDVPLQPAVVGGDRRGDRQVVLDVGEGHQHRGGAASTLNTSENADALLPVATHRTWCSPACVGTYVAVYEPVAGFVIVGKVVEPSGRVIVNVIAVALPGTPLMSVRLTDRGIG
jgi:hypothetical protein